MASEPLFSPEEKPMQIFYQESLRTISNWDFSFDNNISEFLDYINSKNSLPKLFTHYNQETEEITEQPKQKDKRNNSKRKDRVPSVLATIFSSDPYKKRFIQVIKDILAQLSYYARKYAETDKPVLKELYRKNIQSVFTTLKKQKQNDYVMLGIILVHKVIHSNK